MELNYDFVREVMLTCANSKNSHGPSETEIRELAANNQISTNELGFTINRLYEAGFITNKVQYASDVPVMVAPGNLTWDGNEYLNNIRSNSVWSETKDKIKESGLSVSLQVLGSVASSIVKSKLGLQ